MRYGGRLVGWDAADVVVMQMVGRVWVCVLGR